MLPITPEQQESKQVEQQQEGEQEGKAAAGSTGVTDSGDGRSSNGETPARVLPVVPADANLEAEAEAEAQPEQDLVLERIGSSALPI